MLLPKTKPKRRRNREYADVPFPKNPRHKDPKLISEMREEIKFCERCGSPRYREAAHIKGKGAWGPDIRVNIVILCGPAALGMGCHGMDHKGLITEDELFEITAKREGKTVEECKAIVESYRKKESPEGLKK